MTVTPSDASTPGRTRGSVGSIVALIVQITLITVLLWFMLGMLFYAALKIPEGRTIGLVVAMAISMGLIALRARVQAKRNDEAATAAAVAASTGSAQQSGLPPLVHQQMARAITDATRSVAPKTFATTRVAEATRWNDGLTWVIIPLLAAAVAGFFAYQMLTGPITCGGEPLGSGICVDLDNGGRYTASDLANAPVRQPLFWVVVIGAFLALAAYKLYRHLNPHANDVEAFRASVDTERHALQAAVQYDLEDGVRARLQEYATAYDVEIGRAAERLRIPAAT